MNFNLAWPFHEQTCEAPDRVALHVSGSCYSYGQLAGWASRLGFSLQGVNRVGVLATRSLGAYVGVLGACWSGAAYVPLSPKLPEERLAQILSLVALDALVVDEVGLSRLTRKLRAMAPATVLDLSRGLDLLPNRRLPAPVCRAPEDLAYILFTSGTTGISKGVMIVAGSVAHFLSAMQPRWSPVPSDRVSLTSELSFDVSVFEMFGTWGSGASAHAVPQNQLMAPARFIMDQGLTVWSSVPSIAAFMRRMKMLKPNAFPTLRYSVFAGEPLPHALAEEWQTAAPLSIVENLYGPTEATVYCLGATLGPDFPPTPGRDTVPSGFPLIGLEAAILDRSLRFLPCGSEGQLAISGPQVAKGYYNEPDLTAQRFPVIDGKKWYLTGDLSYQDESGIFHHLGRMDHQVKILGQRVELEEIESHMRTLSGCQNVAAIAWPITDGLSSGIVGFTSGLDNPVEELRDALRRRLPAYMVPRRIIELDAFPLGPTGKIDRRILAHYLDQQIVHQEESS